MDNKKSDVLFLITCSYHKNINKNKDNEHYVLKNSITAYLNRKERIDLYEARAKLFNILKSDNKKRDNILIGDSPMNRELCDGPDFNPQSPSNENKYQKAINRYVGRFYSNFGVEDKKNIENSRHHIIIISGLYGAILVNESIQLYDLDIKDSREVVNLWREDDRLTKIILGYIQKWKVNYVFELMGNQNYQRLISWEMIRSKVESLLHTFSPLYAGDDLLPSLGSLLKDLNCFPKKRLHFIKPNDDFPIINDVIYFEKFLQPQDKRLAYREAENISNGNNIDIPKSAEILINGSINELLNSELNFLNTADKIGRMRRNLNQIQKKYLPPIWFKENRSNISFYKKSEYLVNQGGEKAEMGIAMMKFESIRNQVEYDSMVLTEKSLNWISAKNFYETAVEKAIKFHYIIMTDLEYI